MHCQHKELCKYLEAAGFFDACYEYRDSIKHFVLHGDPRGSKEPVGILGKSAVDWVRAGQLGLVGDGPRHHPHLNCPCVIPEIDHCPTCDDSGYLIFVRGRHVHECFSPGGYTPLETDETVDIPCPDCGRRKR